MILVPLHLPGTQDEGVPPGQLNALAFKFADADFRALGIQHGGDRQAQRVPQAAHLLKALQMVRVGIMGEIEPGHIHPGQHELLQQLFLKQPGPHGTYNLCFALCALHRRHSLSYKLLSFFSQISYHEPTALKSKTIQFVEKAPGAPI